MSDTNVAPSAKTQFISLAEFKAKVGATTVDIVRNPNNSKVFAVTPQGNFKVQADLDVTKEIKFMWTEEFSEGCIVNVKSNTIATL